jgi:ABC-type sugar transport system ATPase subunit
MAFSFLYLAVRALLSALVRSRRGLTGVLLMSSDLSEVIGLSDRVLVMFRGALNGSYTGNEVSEEVLLRAANGEAA